MPSPAMDLRRTRSGASLAKSPDRANIPRANSSASTPRSRISLRETPSPRTIPVLASPIHFVPRDSFEQPVSPTAIRSNPFEGRLFDTDTGPIVIEETNKKFDEVAFDSPMIGAGRGAGVSQFHFLDHDTDDEDLYGDSSLEGQRKKGKYNNVRQSEDDGLQEDDIFLDEKRKLHLTPVGKMKKGIANLSPKKIRQHYHHLRQNYPRSTKIALIILASIIPLFLIAIIILVVIALIGFKAPTVYSPNALGASHLTAGSWGFNFSRAINLTMVNNSPMEISVENIHVNIELARAVNDFQGNGSTSLDFKLGPHGDFTSFLLPMKFSYDSQSDTSGDTLDAFLTGCGLVSGSSSSGVTYDLTVTGSVKIFGMFNRDWTDANVGGVLECDEFLKDAVRLMAQLRGTNLSS